METKTRSQITPEYLVAWGKTPAPQMIEELASLHQETNHLPDPYYWIFDLDGDLCTPETGIKINSKIRRDNYVDQVEGLVFDKIFQYVQTQRAALLGKRKPIVWVSPPHPERSADLKIIVSELEEDENGQQILFNRTVLLEYSEPESLEFGRMLTDFSQNRPLLSCLEDLRKTPLILNSSYWLRIMEEIAPSEQWQLIKNGDDKKLKVEALVQARIYQEKLFSHFSPEEQKAVIQEMESSGFIGSYSNSCPITGAFEVFSGYWRRGDCRLCGKSSIEVGPCFVCKKCEEADNQRNNLLAWAA